MNIWWLIAISLMITMALLLLKAAAGDRLPPNINRRFEEAFRRQGIAIPRFAWVGKLDARSRVQRQLERFSRGELEEMRRALVQAGWGNMQLHFYFLLGAWLLPLTAATVTGFYQTAQGVSWLYVLLYMVFAFALVFVSMRRLLRWCARRRQKIMRKEMVTMLHMLRMLFDSGLSLENILQAIEQQGRELIPNLAREMSVVLRRIQAGQDRVDALAEMAAALDVAELTDTVAMLKQVTRYGGNIRDSLAEYSKLVEQRQNSELREYVSKLSGKMSVVMIVFLFPALMIFVAGPGFVGLGKALKGVGG